MALNATPVFPEAFHPYPDSADNAPYEGTADVGEFFSTLLDIINPLQHIPLVSTLYREITGDGINPAARMVGGAVFGGPIGFASASANVLLEQASGDDVMGHALALFADDTPHSPGTNTPLHQAATTITPEAVKAPQLANSNPVAPELDEIVWNGPRFMAAPATTRNPIQLQNLIPNSSALNSKVASAADLKKGTPEWLEKSRDAAQRDETSRAKGGPPQPRNAQPWVANAMFDALDKYEALARTHAKNADAGS